MAGEVEKQNIVHLIKIGAVREEGTSKTATKPYA